MQRIGPILTLALCLPAIAQPPAGAGPSTKLRTSTQLVIVDVVVTGKDHRPVRHLQRNDFVLLEDNVSQVVKTFDEHSADDVKPGQIAPMPTMPLGVFTNYTVAPTNGPINILLIDRLNTPQVDQMRLNQQMLQFLDTLKPGTPIAIFGLTTHLTLLQGFTGNHEFLKAAILGKSNRASSTFLHTDASGGEGPLPSAADVIATNDVLAQQGEAYANAVEFEAGIASAMSMGRARYTLDAMNALARYLGNMPGRKNLIWFSGSFPLQIYDDPLHDQSILQNDSVVDSFHQTASMLTQSQVAVYPIDARGLAKLDINDIAHKELTGLNAGPILQQRFHDMTVELNTVTEEHSTMVRTAYETGGQAFIATNDMGKAVEDAINAGSNYYTFTYSPVNGDWDGQYRKIEVRTRLGDKVTLNYRRGYFAVDTNPNSPRHLVQPMLEGAGVVGPNAMRAALQRGAPDATQLTITASVLPIGTKADDDLGPRDHAGKFLKGPYRHYAIDAVVNPRSLHIPVAADGLRRGSFEFVAFLYDANGNLLNSVDSKVHTHFKPEIYANAMRTGVPVHQQISVPAQGKYFLRLAVHDFENDRVGSLEIPVDAISGLPPLEVAADTAPPALLPAAHSAIPKQADDPSINNPTLPGASTTTP